MTKTSHRLIAGALHWIAANLHFFDPLTDDIKPDPLRSKALAELAFFCDYLRRARPGDAARVQEILAFVSAIWQRDAYRDLVVRNPESLQLYVLTYDSLLHSGFAVADFAPTIQSVIDAGYATSVEAVPFRLMDMRHVFDYGGFAHDLPSMGELVSRTMLARRPSLHYFTNADVYCVTHTIFYLTDFGFAPLACRDHLDISHARGVVDQLLGLYLRLRDWDLTAELMICRACLGQPGGVLGDAGWAGLLGAQLPDGSVPAPGFEPAGPEARRDATLYAFEHNYHTTLVAALAAALC
jgi:hypothetical protein